MSRSETSSEYPYPYNMLGGFDLFVSIFKHKYAKQHKNNTLYNIEGHYYAITILQLFIISYG